MKTFKTILLLLAILSFITSCKNDESNDVEVNTTSIIPSTNNGRDNAYLGCVEINSRITSISVWDHGLIDGDIVSIIANGDTIIDEITLDGPDNPYQVDYDFGYNGYNYITLYAHNLGSVAPNTCTVAINGVEFILEANLDINGAVDVIVTGYGVECN